MKDQLRISGNGSQRNSSHNNNHYSSKQIIKQGQKKAYPNKCLIEHNQVLEQRDRDQKPWNLYDFKMFDNLFEYLGHKFPFGELFYKTQNKYYPKEQIKHISICNTSSPVQLQNYKPQNQIKEIDPTQQKKNDFVQQRQSKKQRQSSLKRQSRKQKRKITVIPQDFKPDSYDQTASQNKSKKKSLRKSTTVKNGDPDIKWIYFNGMWIPAPPPPIYVETVQLNEIKVDKNNPQNFENVKVNKILARNKMISREKERQPSKFSPNIYQMQIEENLYQTVHKYQ